MSMISCEMIFWDRNKDVYELFHISAWIFFYLFHDFYVDELNECEWGYKFKF